VRASLALQCREIGLWPDKILIEVTCKDASKTGLAVCDRQAPPQLPNDTALPRRAGRTRRDLPHSEPTMSGGNGGYPAVVAIRHEPVHPLMR